MAFATSNVSKSVCGNLRVTYGQWTGAVGDASGTIGVEGAQVWNALFSGQDSSGAYVQMPVRFSTSGTNPVTVTVYNLGGITTGRFIIFHL